MCGLIAIADAECSLTRRSLQPALQRMRRRGPDQEDEWQSDDQQARLGHCRLSIVDLSEAGRQPMFNEDGTITLVCNGEIYNYPSLKQRLQGLGHTFRSQSDSEVILHAYEEWGTNCLDHLIGMFAFVIWDSNRQQLFAARDHSGIKPLYYASLPHGIALASNLDALIEQVGIAPEPDSLALAYALSMRYVPAPLAIWKGTAKLEAGHQLVWSQRSGLLINRYWEPPTEIVVENDRSDQQWETLFHEVLSDHLLADVPIGIFLSGGLDSNSLAGGLHHIGYSAEAIAGSLPEFAGDEFPVADESARRLGFNCHQVDVHSSKAAHYHDDLLEAFDEPEVDSGPLPMFLVCERAKHHMKVVLGGDGGDECFAGYKWYHKPANRSLRAAWRDLRHRCRAGQWSSLTQRQDPLLADVLARSNPFSTQEIAKLLRSSGLKFNNELRVEPFRKHFRKGLPRLRALQRMDLMTFSTDACLFKVDRVSMFHSLEVRVPFLDRRIVEWALSSPISPDEQQLQTSKPLLRRYVDRAGLSHVLNQPKSGFGMKGSELKNVSEAMLRQIDESWLGQSGFLDDSWRSVITGKHQIAPHKLWPLNYLAQWVSRRMEKTQLDHKVCPESTRPKAQNRAA